MGKRLVRSMLLVFVWSVAGTSVAADAGSVRAVPDGQFVLEQIQKRLETISNYQCTQITTRVRWNRRDPNRVAEDIDRKSIAYDREGRRRVREVSENLDARTYIWDGTQTIEVCERVERNGTVVYSASVFPGQCDQVTGGHLPWRYLGEFLARALKSALASGRAIHVGRIENGCCRLEFYTGGRTAIVAILDPARGYLPILEAHLPPGGAGQWEEIESREIEPGVWFPVAVRTRSSQAQQSGPPAHQYRRRSLPDFFPPHGN